MVSFPNCKINLGLRITGKRDDGYHDLETVFYPIPLQDALEIITAPDKETRFSQTGISIQGSPHDNLCMKAYHLLKKDFSELPPIWIHLHKTIPAGAGLGGGSADAAFTLLGLNKKYKLGISDADLSAFAIKLGSDCPFFIRNQPAYASGRGEKLHDIEVDLKAFKIVVINPGIHISTAWAFSQVKPAPSTQSLRDIIRKPVKEWRGLMVNDFEAIVAAAHPEISELIEMLYQNGAVYAAMSGSGSTVYGLFDKDVNIAFDLPPQYFVKYI